MTWQNNLDFPARVIKTSKRLSAVLMIDILTVCSHRNDKYQDIYWGKWNHNRATSFPTLWKEKKQPRIFSSRNQSTTKALGKWSCGRNKAQENIFIKLMWHLLFPCLEEQCINIQVGDQNQKPTFLLHFCSIARFCVFHSPMQIYFCLFGKSYDQEKAQSLGKKNICKT